MNPSPISILLPTKRDGHSASTDGRRRRRPHFGNTRMFQELKVKASDCRTPKRFRELLEGMRKLIPYQKLAAVWGYHAQATIRYVFNHGFPKDFRRWYLSTGTLWTSPVFREWYRTKRAVMVSDVVHRFKEDFQPELIRQYEQAGVYHAICGGRSDKNYFVYFAAAMASARSGRRTSSNSNALFHFSFRRASVRTRGRCLQSAKPPFLSVEPWERLLNRLRKRKTLVSARFGSIFR